MVEFDSIAVKKDNVRPFRGSLDGCSNLYTNGKGDYLCDDWQNCDQECAFAEDYFEKEVKK